MPSAGLTRIRLLFGRVFPRPIVRLTPVPFKIMLGSLASGGALGGILRNRTRTFASGAMSLPAGRPTPSEVTTGGELIGRTDRPDPSHPLPTIILEALKALA